MTHTSLVHNLHAIKRFILSNLEDMSLHTITYFDDMNKEVHYIIITNKNRSKVYVTTKTTTRGCMHTTTMYHYKYIMESTCRAYHYFFFFKWLQ